MGSVGQGVGGKNSLRSASLGGCIVRIGQGREREEREERMGRRKV